MNDHIKHSLVRAAEESGSDRVIDWSLSTFERIGGSNVLKNIWLLLKNSHRTRGEKRELPLDSSTESGTHDGKKHRVSLNLSLGTLGLKAFFLIGRAMIV